jgi:hypothetical protein
MGGPEFMITNAHFKDIGGHRFEGYVASQVINNLIYRVGAQIPPYPISEPDVRGFF